MNDNPLDRAASSLREQTQAAVSHPDESDAGLHLVLRGARTAARRRKTIRVMMLQLCAGFVGFGAWAAGTGKLAYLSRSVEEPQHQTHATTVPRPRVSEPAPVLEVDDEPPVTASPAESPPGQLLKRRTESRALSNHAPSKHETIATVEPSVSPQFIPPPVDFLSEYRSAYRTQFVEKNLERAVELWSQYLRLGDTVLSVDARFNRAVALARLMRTNEANAELTPFASGEYGGYRKNEAKRLLEWLKTRQDKR